MHRLILNDVAVLCDDRELLLSHSDFHSLVLSSLLFPCPILMVLVTKRHGKSRKPSPRPNLWVQ